MKEDPKMKARHSIKLDKKNFPDFYFPPCNNSNTKVVHPLVLKNILGHFSGPPLVDPNFSPLFILCVTKSRIKEETIIRGCIIYSPNKTETL